jgi:hypothetical protein
MLEGLHDRALAIDGANLQILRSELVRDDNKKLFGADEERYRLGFGAVITNIWVPAERQAEAEDFAAAVDAARESSTR